MAIGRDEFLRATARRYATVEVPSYGEVRMQSLTAAEMRSIRRSLRTEAGAFDNERFARIDALVVAAALVDDDGDRLFSDDDVMCGVLDHVDGGPWAVLCAAVKAHTGWDADRNWKPIEAALKN